MGFRFFPARLQVAEAELYFRVIQRQAGNHVTDAILKFAQFGGAFVPALREHMNVQIAAEPRVFRHDALLSRFVRLQYGLSCA